MRSHRKINFTVLEDGGPVGARPGYQHVHKLTVPQARVLEEAAVAALKGYTWLMCRPGKTKERMLAQALKALRWCIDSAILR